MDGFIEKKCFFSIFKEKYTVLFFDEAILFRRNLQESIYDRTNSFRFLFRFLRALDLTNSENTCEQRANDLLD